MGQYSAVAQSITPDTTLGSEGAIVTPIDPLTDHIEGGAARGINLFHSFQEFGIGQQHTANFVNPAGIENIFSRVTGSSRSDILGTLGVLGNANLFFINPNGILFGPDASLNIQGSFTASTANELVFADGSTFSALNPVSPPLLSVDVSTPIEVVFGEIPGDILNKGQLSAGSDLALVANDLNLEGQLLAGDSLSLQASGNLSASDSAEQAFIATSGGDLLVEGAEKIDINILEHPDSSIFSGGDLILRSNAPINGDAHFVVNGNFQIEQLEGGLGDLLSEEDPIILAAGDVNLANHTGASLHILAGGSISLGNVIITGPGNAGDTIGPNNPDPTLASLANVVLSNGTSVTVDGSAQSTLDVRAGIDWDKIGGLPGNPVGGVSPGLTSTPIFSEQTDADISVGSVQNNSGFVLLTNQFEPDDSLSGDIVIGKNDTVDVSSTPISVLTRAPGGDVIVNSRGAIEVASSINAFGFGQSFFGIPVAFGDGGNVTLRAEKDITFLSSAGIDTNGIQSGRITLQTSGNIQLKSDISNPDPLTSSNAVNGSATESIARQGGGIFIEANSFSVENNSLSIGDVAGVTSLTFSDLDAGDINIDVTEALELRSAGSQITTASFAEGSSGDVNIQAGNLSLVDSTFITATTFSDGDAGNVNIVATESVNLGGPGNSTFNLPAAISALSISNGNAGNVSITTPVLVAIEGGNINATTIGDGDAGDVTINANRIQLEGIANNEQSGIVVSSCSQFISGCGNGSAGNVFINTNTLDISAGATIEAFTASAGNAGTITIEAADSVSLGGSGIFMGNRSPSGIGAATTSSGNAGNVEINTNIFEVTEGASADVATIELDSQNTATNGNAGTIAVNANSILIDGTNSRITAVSQGEGAAGNVNFVAEQVAIQNGAVVQAGSEGSADAGNVEITAEQLTVANRSQVDVSNELAGNGGTLIANTRNIFLEDLAGLIADTDSGEGGLIDISNLGIILLRGNSIISAESNSDLGNSGNIEIDTSFLFSPPGDNSDIIASAFKEGNINIKAQGIFGLEARENLTPFSDITATGIITLNLPNFDPTEGLTALPTEPRETEVDNTCRVSSNADAVQFYDVGRGGTPPRPDDVAEAGLDFLLEEDLFVRETEPNGASIPAAADSSDESVEGLSPSQWELVSFVPLPACADTP
ncbi:MAG: filamentous hemagglutinin N-terminal domain-containing protein [Cyanobacteria bacterium P01_B01_bin.77]